MQCQLRIAVGEETRTDEVSLPVGRDARPGKLMEASWAYVKREYGKSGVLLSVKPSGAGFRISGPRDE